MTSAASPLAPPRTESAPPQIERPRSARVGHPAFRADIEGLRALAVLAVVAYHAGVPGFGGGFVGVDIFFVISGFLITGLLLAEARRTGRVALASFWARRARRLLPLSALVLALTAVASALILPPLERAVALRDVVAASLYAANWAFAARETPYLTGHTDSSPVLHYWSLGVEEQFYLVWPLLMVAVLAVCVRRARWQRLHLPLLAGTLAGVWVLSLVLSMWWTRTDQPLAFFGLPTRAWQLATGGLLALAATQVGRLAPSGRAVLGWAGIAGLVGTLLWVRDGSMPYPGLAALAPTLSAAALLAAGCGAAAARGAPGVCLGLAPLRTIGRLSYGWYLWHWPPLILLPAALGRPLGLAGACAVSVCTLALSAITYRWVEQPMRYAPRLTKAPRYALSFGAVATVLPAVLAGALVLGTAGAASSRTVLVDDGRGGTTSVQLRLSPIEAQTDESPLIANGCQLDPWDTAPPASGCDFGATGSARRAVLVGDSHASQWFSGLDVAAREEGVRLTTWTKSVCPLGEVSLTWQDAPYRECRQWNDAVQERLAANPPEMVIVSGSAGRDMRPVLGEDGRALPEAQARQAWADGLARSLRALQATGARVVLIRDTPVMAQNASTCLASTGNAVECATPRAEAVTDPPPDVRVARAVGVEVWDLTSTLCDAQQCQAVVGDTIAWWDRSHLSASFSATLAPQLRARLTQSG